MYRRKAILVNTVMFLAAAMITATIVGALIPNGRSDFMRVAALQPIRSRTVQETAVQGRVSCGAIPVVLGLIRRLRYRIPKW